MTSNSSLPLTCPAPRIALACENCRARKVRCLPSAKTGICRRCLDSHLTCLFQGQALKRPSPRRKLRQPPAPPTTPASTMSTSSPTWDILSGLFTLAPKTEKIHGNGLNGIQSLHRRIFERLFALAPREIPNGTAVRPENQGSPPSAEEHSGKSTVDAAKAQRYLTRYQELNVCIPFVVLPEEWTMDSILRSHPFLLLGILTAMSAEDPHLHSRLDAEFRKALSDKAIIRGEKSLDILQGLLVYIYWYPVHLSPRNDQLFQFLHIAISMSVDLKYNSPHESGDSTIQQEDPNPARRAYLGCYYISSVLSIPPKRPNNVIFNDVMEGFLSALSENPTSKLDKLLVSCVMLQRVAEETLAPSLTADQAGSLGHGSLLEARISNFQSRLKVIESALPSDALSYLSVLLLHKSINMKIHCIAVSPEFSVPEDVVASKARADGISRGLHATKAVFESFLSIPLNEYRSFSQVEWCRLIQTIICLFSICSAISTVPEVDATTRCQTAQFGVYLESLCFRMEELTKTGKGSKSPPDIFCMFSSVLRVVRDTYEDMMSAILQADFSSPSLGSPQGSLPTMCPVLNGSIMDTEYWDILNDNYTTDTLEGKIFGNGTIDSDLFPHFEAWDAWESVLVGNAANVQNPDLDAA